MFIVIELQYTSHVTGEQTSKSFSFSNNRELVSQEILERYHKKFGGYYILPRLFYMQDLGNNGNPFIPNNGESRYALIMQANVQLFLPPDCIETGKDASELLDLIDSVGKTQLSDLFIASPFKDQMKVLIKEAQIEIDQRVQHIKNAASSVALQKFPGVKSAINETKIKKL